MKKSKTKEKASTEQEAEIETNDDAEEVVGPKAKKSVDLESALEPAAIIDEKIDDELPVSLEDEDSASEEISLDDEELNPFGDKWEQ